MITSFKENKQKTSGMQHLCIHRRQKWKHCHLFFSPPVNAFNFKGTNLPIPHLPDTYTLNENCELSALCISWKTFKNQPHQQPNDLIISTEASNLLKNVSLDIRIQITYCLVFCRDVFFGVLCVYVRIHACTRVYFVGLSDH